MERSDLYGFLQAHRLGVISTTGSDGAPQAALVGVAVTPDLQVIFDTVKATRKYANLLRDDRCALAIGWDGEQTAQIEGRAVAVESSRDDPRLAPYFAVFPDGADRLGWPGIVHFIVTPHWIRYSDFAAQPPLIVTWP